MAGAEYFGETTVHPRDGLWCSTKRKETIFDPRKAYGIRRNETKQSLTLEKSDGWAALFFCNPITVVIVLLQLLTIWTR